MNRAKELCLKFLDNPERDPRTNRKIDRFDQEYEDNVQSCLRLGYRKDIGELRAREQLLLERARERARIGERKLPPRMTNSPEKITKPITVIRPTIPIIKPITDPFHFQRLQNKRLEEELEEEEAEEEEDEYFYPELEYDDYDY